jgi:hypothetical protein
MSEWLSTGSNNPYPTEDELAGLMQSLDVGKPFYEPRANGNNLADAIMEAFVDGRLTRSLTHTHTHKHTHTPRATVMLV